MVLFVKPVISPIEPSTTTGLPPVPTVTLPALPSMLTVLSPVSAPLLKVVTPSPLNSTLPLPVAFVIELMLVKSLANCTFNLPSLALTPMLLSVNLSLSAPPTISKRSFSFLLITLASALVAVAAS